MPVHATPPVFRLVSPDYFRTYGIRLVKGRLFFTDRDVAGAPRVAVVSENFARRYLPGAEPIGERLTIEQLIPGVTRLGPPVDWEIVGFSPMCVTACATRPPPRLMFRSIRVRGRP